MVTFPAFTGGRRPRLFPLCIIVSYLTDHFFEYKVLLNVLLCTFSLEKFCCNCYISQKIVIYNDARQVCQLLRLKYKTWKKHKNTVPILILFLEGQMHYVPTHLFIFIFMLQICYQQYLKWNWMHLLQNIQIFQFSTLHKSFIYLQYCSYLCYKHFIIFTINVRVFGVRTDQVIFLHEAFFHILLTWVYWLVFSQVRMMKW